MSVAAGAGDVAVTLRPGSVRLEEGQRAKLDQAVALLRAEAPNPGRVEVVVTDRFELVAGQLAATSPVQGSQTPAEDYTATQADGSLAVARTIDLPDDRVAVVVPAGLLSLDEAVVRRVLVHEAQHVRLLQQGNPAFGVHRRLGLGRPDGLMWEFVWFAEIALDEFRCERAVHKRGLAAQTPELDVSPDEFQGITEVFEQVKRDFRDSQREIMPAYHGAFQALKRLTVYLAYGAAQLVAEPDRLAAWGLVPPMEQMLRIVRPTTLDTEDAQLGEIVIELAAASRKWLRISGFDYYPDQGGGYLEVLP